MAHYRKVLNSPNLSSEAEPIRVVRISFYWVSDCDQKARVCQLGAEYCEAGRLKFRICRHLLDNAWLVTGPIFHLSAIALRT
jgi:hypothetical protein